MMCKIHIKYICLVANIVQLYNFVYKCRTKIMLNKNNTERECFIIAIKIYGEKQINNFN